MPDIKRALAAGGVHAPELHRERLVREREKTEGDILSKTPSEQREWFAKVMRCAQTAQFFSEDHSYHVGYKSAARWRDWKGIEVVQSKKRFPIGVGYGFC